MRRFNIDGLIPKWGIALALFASLYLGQALGFTLQADAYNIGQKKFGHNYFGQGSGTTTISADTNVTTTTDGDFAIVEYGNLTVNSGKTLTVSNRCKGLIIYVNGDLDVEGTITMTARGANLAAPAEGINRPLFINSSGARGIITDYKTPATGGAGKTAQTGNPGGLVGKTGGTLANAPGGGGTGGGAGSGAGQYGNSGASKDATCFSGGSGSGGGGYNGTSGINGTDAGANGGAGGDGATGNDGSHASGGGAGNPAGSSTGTGSGTVAPSAGTGGDLFIYVKGNCTIGAAGVISSNGSNGGGYTGASNCCAGGGSGGGKVGVWYGGSLSNSGSVVCNGGSGGANGAGAGFGGGPGGAGAVVGPTKIAGP